MVWTDEDVRSAAKAIDIVQKNFGASQGNFCLQAAKAALDAVAHRLQPRGGFEVTDELAEFAYRTYWDAPKESGEQSFRYALEAVSDHLAAQAESRLYDRIREAGCRHAATLARAEKAEAELDELRRERDCYKAEAQLAFAHDPSAPAIAWEAFHETDDADFLELVAKAVCAQPYNGIMGRLLSVVRKARAELEELRKRTSDPEGDRLEALITYWERFPGTTYGECARQARESIAADGARDRTSEPEGDRLTAEERGAADSLVMALAALSAPEIYCDRRVLLSVIGSLQRLAPKPAPVDPLQQLLAEMERNQDPDSASSFWARRVREALSAKESGK